jgi:hypothetical protein
MRIVQTCKTVVALGVALAALGCDGLGINDPTPPDLESATDFIEAVVDVDGTHFDAFDILKTEYTQITLIGILTADPKRPLDVAMGLRLGRPSAEGCSPLVVTNAAPSFQAHQGMVLERGTYCLDVFDIGNITEQVTVRVRVVHPAPIVQPRPGTVTSSSVITVGGSATRSFEATGPGHATVTLTNLQPNVTTGLGLGIYDSSSSNGCRLTRVIETTARSSAHFTAFFDPGSYCVQVFDIGNYTQTTSYTVQIQHP